MIYLIIWSVAGVLLAYGTCILVSHVQRIEDFLDANLPTQLIMLAICGPLVWYAVDWGYITMERDLIDLCKETDHE